MDGEQIESICSGVPLQTDRHPRIEYHKFRGRDSDTKRNLKLLADGRQPVLPYLTNVPQERRDEVEETLARWFEATNYLLVGQYTSLVLKQMPPDAFVENFQRAAAAYRTAIELNPEDLNAQFLYRRAIARYEVGVSSLYYNNGDIAQGLEHARRAAEVAPNTLWGAMARFLLESSSAVRLVPQH
jgi:tetratricopeptide (TPR) repeat protein